MTKYINLKVGQSVTHKKYKGRGDVVSFDPEQGFLVRWLHNGQDVYYSPGTSLLEVVEHTVEKTGCTKSRLLAVLLGKNLDDKTFDDFVDATLSVGRESNALDKDLMHNTAVKVELRNQITGRTLKDMQAQIGDAQGALDFNRRVQGTTTGQALSLISTAILKPYIWHTAGMDHHGTVCATYEMFQRVKYLVDKLELKGFEFMRDHQIRFVPIIKETTRSYSETVTESYR